MATPASQVKRSTGKVAAAALRDGDDAIDLKKLLRALQWLAIPLLAEVILSLRSQPWWPHLLVCGSRTLGCWPR